MSNPLYEEIELSVDNADSTLQIVKEQQPITTDKPEQPHRLAACGYFGLSTLELRVNGGG